MWITGKLDHSSHKENLFNELYSECRLAAPAARLSYPLRNKIDRLIREDRKDIVSRTKDGCAPLFLACKKGNVEIVEYLIKECCADVEQRGMYEVPDDRSIHHVTPLWCAAVAGKLNVVKCLVQHGAQVNSVSDTGSTPVRSACFMTHNDIVKYLVENEADILKPNYNGGTCLINSVQSVPLCHYLLQHGASVNAQDIQFKTALHYAIQEHRFETTKLLIENNADVMMKSRYGDDALQTACLKGATQIFDYLIAQIPYSTARIAEAHELMGSTFLDEHHDLPTALLHWRKALKVRCDTSGQPLMKPTAPVTRTAYQHAVEFQTLAELETLALDLDSMRIQSLLICERILGPLHKDMIFRLMYRGAAYADSLQYQRCIDLWRYALKLRIAKDSLLHSEACFTAQALVRLFLDLLEKHSSGILSEDVQFQDVVETIMLIVNQFQSSIELLKIQPVFKRQLDSFDKTLKVLTHLFYILLVVAKSSSEKREMYNLIERIVNMNLRNSSCETLLHLAVSKSNTMKAATFFDNQNPFIFPNAQVVELLLECGANPNAVNLSNNTPLHFASVSVNYFEPVLEVLLKNGAHIDWRNGQGKLCYEQMAEITECKINPLNFLSLRCLAARTVVENHIPYKGEVPVCLEKFISFH